MIRENVAAIGDELYAAYWWCRCKAASTVALAGVSLVEYCRWRGPSAVVALLFARRLIGLSRLLVPGPLKPLTEAVCGDAK